MFEIRKVKSNEVDEALNLVHDVFIEFEAPDYKPEGVETFIQFLKDENVINDFKSGTCPMYGAFDNGKIIGVIGMRETKKHINLAFVRKEYHRKGIATAIFQYLINDLQKENLPISEITVNSSPYGYPFYLHLGFIPESEEKEKDGIRFTPMKYTISK
ncbi:hypothetical protein M9Y10_039722 [Tritrichomonas musculus]|uniref:N-acetyltransferase domain-containing protein n=1 Tax=Tritrichomonas musculus TaxID=1915356 RepID=A0ABR2GR37_9EUKA